MVYGKNRGFLQSLKGKRSFPVNASITYTKTTVLGTGENHGVPLTKFIRKNQSIIKNTGDTILKQAIIPGKNFYYPCTLYSTCYCLPTGIVSGNEYGGDSFV